MDYLEKHATHFRHKTENENKQNKTNNRGN